ncbi:MAG: hypothetical protein ACSW8G_07800 [Bacillota bacterium]
MKEKAKELTKAYEDLHEEAKHSLQGLEKLIEKNSMSPEDVVALIDNKMEGDVQHPELKSIEEMTSEDYAAMYKKMAEDVKTSPEKFEAHLRASGMSADELALLFESINGAIEKYPEVWEAQKNAELLHPKNLAVLVSGFGKKY